MNDTVSQKELNAQKYMEHCVKEFKIFIDTCSIIEAKSSFWEHIKPYLKKIREKDNRAL